MAYYHATVLLSRGSHYGHNWFEKPLLYNNTNWLQMLYCFDYGLSSILTYILINKKDVKKSKQIFVYKTF